MGRQSWTALVNDVRTRPEVVHGGRVRPSETVGKKRQMTAVTAPATFPDEPGDWRSEWGALWNYNQAARYLGLSPRTLRRWVKEQRVPHRRMGKYVRFTHDDCDEILRHWAVAVPPRRARNRGRN